ncbi:lysozyme inhibitor LprI family protein [Oceanospirillum sanctuarii]|uniref:lysozyme inhibitor LprI family protein n=1 Tax=Oceanospirillum sanctuarii TaxID=1434821 RepID=UPI000A3674E0|nr:hypothetical protein [Oceanospirillum sanctuarii]
MKRFARLSLLLSGAVAFLSLPAQAASFDCKLAKAPIELQICSTESLSVMDEVIGKLYFKARNLPGQEGLKESQKTWLKARNNACEISPLRECEQVFIDRIGQLLQAVREPQPESLSVKMLQQGMLVPTLDQLDQYSREKAEALGADIYTPWPRKQLLKMNISSIPVVALVDNKPFVYFTFHNPEVRKQCLYEYNILENKGVQGKCDIGTQVGLYGDQILVNQHWSKNDEYYGVTAGTLFEGDIFEVGIDDKPEFFANQIREQSAWMASKDGNKLAVVARFVFDEDLASSMPYQQSLQLERMREMTNPEMLKDARPLVVYDRVTDKVSMSPDLLPNEDDYYWESIFGIRWNEDSKTVFFDNEGSRLACIWEFDPSDNKLYKIVPESEAINPYPFTLDGQDFIVYSVDNKIMMAARPR